MKKTSSYIFTILIIICLYPKFGISQNADFYTDNSSLNYCAGDTVFFYNASSGYDYVLWDFGNNMESYTENPRHRYTLSGEYTVTLIAYASNGNSDTAKITLQINPLPDIAFDVPDDTVQSNANSLTINAFGDYDYLLWSVGSENSFITVNESGYYSLTAFYNGTGCSKTIGITVIFSTQGTSESGISVRNNVLTPNSPGVNDVLYINRPDETCPCEIIIYNRAGIPVYHNSNYQNSWTGKDNKGIDLPSGTYYYLIKATDMPHKTGFIDILRQ